MFETLGIILIVCGAGGLTALAVYALLPGLVPTHGWRHSSRIRIEDKRLLSVADLTPPSAAPVTAQPARLNPRLADDLFAEVFALRTNVAEMTRELRSIREQLEAVAASEDSDPSAAMNAA